MESSFYTIYNRLRLLDVNNNFSTPKKCLFGIPNPQDTKIMLEEQDKENYERFMKRFGIDIDNLDASQDQENLRPEYKQARSKNVVDRKTNKHDKFWKPYNKQMKITDYCNAKKSSQRTTKNK